MTDREDPDRVAAVRRALDKLLDVLARAVVREPAEDAEPPNGDGGQEADDSGKIVGRGGHG